MGTYFLHVAVLSIARPSVENYPIHSIVLVKIVPETSSFKLFQILGFYGRKLSLKKTLGVQYLNNGSR